MDKIPLVEKHEVDGEAAEAWDALPFDLALFHITAHAQNVFQPWLRFNGAAMGQGVMTTLDPLLKELAVVQASVLSRSSYEWGNHGRGALYAGATQAQIDALVKEEDIEADVFNDTQKLVLKFTSEVVTDARPSEETLTTMGKQFANRQIVEFVYAICTYMMNSRLANLGDLKDGDDRKYN